MPSSQDAYTLKRQLSDKEAKKIASTPPVDNPLNAGGTPATTETPKPPTLTPTPSSRPQASSPRPKASPHAPTSHDNTITTKHGIVVHNIALRKDLGNVRRWLEASNKDVGKILGIRWLRKKTILVEEGKKTSSAVVYLETQKEIGKVKLGGRWLRTSVYEPDRGRK